MSMRGLTDASGRFSILAIDHRDSLREFLAPGDPMSIDAATITQLKIEIVEVLGDLVTGVMLEPEYSIPHVIDAGVLPDGVGFLAALEAQGYLDDPEAQPTRVLPGWTPAMAKASGAACAKLLLPYRPDGRLVREQEEVARHIVEECHAIDLPIALEPLFYGLATPSLRSELVVETARRFATFGADLLKLPYPGSDVACGHVTDALDVPWAMLSGGGPFDTFTAQLSTALAAGCSGFMVGRALWGEALRASTPDERADLLHRLVRPRLVHLRELAKKTNNA